MKHVITAIMFALAAPAAAQDIGEEIISYMDFATETQGIILAQQLTKDVFEEVTFVDTRSPEDFAKGTIGDARHIEWRSVPARLDELPETGLVVLFCNTGVRSSQAMFAARLMGRDNVLVLQGGYEGWMRDAAYRP